MSACISTSCPVIVFVLLVQVTAFDALDELRSDVSTKLRVWCALRDWEAAAAAWLITPIQDIVADDIEKQVQQYMKTAIQVGSGVLGMPVLIYMTLCTRTTSYHGASGGYIHPCTTLHVYNLSKTLYIRLVLATLRILPLMRFDASYCIGAPVGCYIGCGAVTIHTSFAWYKG